MKWKLLVSMLLTATAVFCLILTPVYAEEGDGQGDPLLPSGSIDSIDWLIDENGTLLLSGNGAVPDFSPGSYAPWYDYGPEIHSISVGEGITAIGDYAFLYCEEVTLVTLPQGITRIGIQTFSNCTSLARIVLPETVQSVGAYAFAYCSSLRFVEFLGNAPSFGQYCFYGVTASVTAHCTQSGWTEDIRLPYGGTLTWTAHSFDEGTVIRKADCVNDGIMEYRCAECGESIREPILSTGHSGEHVAAKEPNCKESGSKEYWHCTVCDKFFSDSTLTEEISEEKLTIPPKGHETVIDEEVPATPDNPGKTRGEHCSRCGEIFVPQEEIPALGYTVSFPDLPYGTEVMIGGEKYSVDSNHTVHLTSPTEMLATAHWYVNGAASSADTDYPFGMKVYRLNWDDTGTTVAEGIPELTDIMLYGGTSIRSVGMDGIRLYTALPQQKFSSFVNSGAGGYSLVECGSLLAFSDLVSGELLLTTPNVVRSASVTGTEMHLELNSDGTLLTYSAELTDLSANKGRVSVVMRPYMILAGPDGNHTAIYGGSVTRTVGYVAWQNRALYTKGTERYERLWSFIHAQYGKTYDSEY